MKKEDKDLQAFLKQQYAYQEKKAAMEKGSGTQDGVDHKEDEEDARATMK